MKTPELDNFPKSQEQEKLLIIKELPVNIPLVNQTFLNFGTILRRP